MLKRILAIVLCFALLPLFPALAEETQESARVLVAYFSRAGENYNVGVIEKGNTAILAELIAEQTSADLFVIAPVTPYPEGYEETKTIAEQEYEAGARPEMAQTLDNLDAYDTVFVGYPIWWAGMPMILYTFLESVDFTGKTVIPFNTHEGSGQGETVADIKTLLPDATVLDGFAVRGTTMQNDEEAARKTVSDYLATLTQPGKEKKMSNIANVYKAYRYQEYINLRKKASASAESHVRISLRAAVLIFDASGKFCNAEYPLVVHFLPR